MCGFSTALMKVWIGVGTPTSRPRRATAPLSHAQQRELGFGKVMAWDTERPYHYLRWTPDRRLLIGGCDHTVVPGRRRAAALRTATGELRGYFERLLPARWFPQYLRVRQYSMGIILALVLLWPGALNRVFTPALSLWSNLLG